MSGGDLFSALQDDLVQHVLSFLPSRDAVKSATLSRRWRHLWRSTPAVRVRGDGEAFRLFVNTLLIHRDGASPLRLFEIDAAGLLIRPSTLTRQGYDSDEDGDYDYYEERKVVDPYIDMWIRHAVSTCRARSLTACFKGVDTMWSPPQPPPFASSPHLTTMHLQGVKLADGLLDFSCCPALLHLTLRACRLHGEAFVAPSLERLSIIDSDIQDGCGEEVSMTPTRICAPSLRYLQLSDEKSDWDPSPTAPSLESLPLLTSASIQLSGDTQICYEDDDDSATTRSLLLHGLSETTSLELIASTTQGREILLRDLTWCPVFTKLKTLILNEWCVYDDVTALACLMRHTPRIEDLILVLNFKKPPISKVKTEGIYITSEHPFLTYEHLKTVEIKKCRRCYEARVNEILKLFSDCGIPSSKIRIHYKKSQGSKK